MKKKKKKGGLKRGADLSQRFNINMEILKDGFHRKVIWRVLVLHWDLLTQDQPTNQIFFLKGPSLGIHLHKINQTDI